MRKNEARALGQQMQGLPVEAIEPVLNLGSSTERFRTIEQPHIDEEIFAPLRRRGVKILHADLKEAEGVDLVGNVYDLDYQRRMREINPRLIFCSNMLEHLTEREKFVETCDAMLAPGGYLVLTVPHDYPYHQDPIDTYYRPSPSELSDLLPHYECVWSESVEDSTFGDDWRAMPGSEKLRRIVSLWKAPYLYFADRERFLGRYHRWLWFSKPYRVSCVLLRKPETT